MKDLSDKLLLELIKEDDQKAFKHLFNYYFAYLCRYAVMYTKEAEASEELVLDIFTYIWENRNDIEIKTSLKSYLFKAVRNRCLNYTRNRKEAVSIDSLAFDISAGDNSDLEIKELVRFVQEALMSMPDKHRQVFIKSRIHNLSNKEIAEQMNVSVKTVEAQITKTLKVIRKYISHKWYLLVLLF